jgi:sulfur relay (sulfurtransferase) complex TusBCD TusD component (DsrE family)
MTNYIFIETRDPFESRDTQFIEQTATALKQRGHAVTVFLVQNGVLASRRNARESYLSRLVDAGINLQADDFSLSERGIQTAELQPGVQPSSIEMLVDSLLQENTKAIWH